MQSVYFIIPTGGIGGAEKRFIELWSYLVKDQREFDFKLIISEQLFIAVKDNKEIYDLLQPYENKLKTFSANFDDPTVRFQKNLYGFICAHTTKDDILHFILSFPAYVLHLRHHRTLYSLTESSLKNVNFKGKILYMLNMLRSRYVDILDPVVYGQVKKVLFFKKDRIRLTPGSFTNTEIFQPAEHFEKENWFVFLGRFFYLKQVIRLLKAMPEIIERLHSAGFKDFKFMFLGYGQQEKEMQEIISSPAYRGLPFEIKMTNRPQEILARSKVIFSLQLRNNYPSKSLLEGLAAGNIPLVTDVGSTRLIAKPEFSYYVSEEFSAGEIADQLISILSLDKDSLHKKIKAARQLILSNYSIKTSATYYHSIYRALLQ